MIGVVVLLLALLTAVVEYFIRPAPKTIIGGKYYTYCAVSDFMDPVYIRQALSGLDIRDVPIQQLINGKRSVDFFYYDGPSSMAKKYYHVRAAIRYWLDCEDIWDKAKLHTILTRLAPDTICETILFDDPRTATLPPGVWMIRSNLGRVGRKSRAVDNQADFATTVNDFLADSTVKKDKIMASQYILDPMLYVPPGGEGRKFHMRCYVIIAAFGHGDTTHKAWMINHGLMIPARNAYKAHDWSNPGVHDSHGHDNPDSKYWPGEFDRPDIVDACADVLGRALRVLLPTVRNYPETGKIGYEIMGADVMMLADGTAKIIEINGAPAIGDNTVQSKHDIFDAVLATVLVGLGPVGNPAMVRQIV